MPGRLMPWLVLVSSAALYLALGQGSLYGDGPGLLLGIRGGRAFENVIHYLHGPVVLGIWRLMEPLGFSLYQAALLSSGLGTALGIMCLYLASQRLLGDWRSAAGIAALVATCPGVLFYATVVELHGLFLAFFGLVALALTNMSLRPTMGNAVVLGVATAVASLAHASGHLLPVVVLLLGPVLSCGRGTPAGLRRWLNMAGVAILVHLTVAVSVLGALRLLGWGGASVGFAVEHVFRHMMLYWQRLASSPLTLLDEWLLPFFPISVACIVSVTDKSGRCLLASLYVLVVLYVLITAMMVHGVEFGAYFLPLAWPAAILVARVFSPRWVLLLSVVGLCIAIPRLRVDETIDHTRRAVAALTNAHPQEKLLLLAVTKKDLELCFTGMPGADFLYLPDLALNDAVEVRKGLPYLDSLLNKAMTDGKTVLLSEEGGSALMSAETAAMSTGPAAVAAHLRTAYRETAVRLPGFRGWQLARLKR